MAIEINVLSNGELFKQVLNATSTFIYGNGFVSLLKVGAFVGIVLSTIQSMRTRDPSVFAKWFAMYLIVTTAVIAPRTTATINDVSQPGRVLAVSNVPVAFAIPARIITSLGFGMGQAFDMLFTMPDDMTYTKTGMLFGSQVMQAMHKTRIADSDLRAEFSGYFKNCVVGDIRLTRKYSPQQLRGSTNIGGKIFDNSSILRRTVMRDGATVTCKNAGEAIRKSLNDEIKNNTYKSLWTVLLGKNLTSVNDQNNKSEESSFYSSIMSKHIKLGSEQFQGMRDESTNILRQTLLINAIDDGMRDYQSYVNSQAGLENYNYSKSQMQHRNAWMVMGKKAIWFLPYLHTILLLLMFAMFPIVLVMCVTPIGGKIMQSYVTFFISLQLWPVFFAVLNLVMTYYGKGHSLPHGGLTMANIDSVDQVHFDISGVAGYTMMLIPFIANGLVSRGLAQSFGGLATTMTGHVQGSTMGVAGEVAGGNFSVGQSNYMNSSSNNLNANKHDTNWSNMQGMQTEQLASGATHTKSADNQDYVDSRGAMGHSAIGISSTSGIQRSLTEAKENALSAVKSHQSNFVNSTQSAANQAVNYTDALAHDIKTGHGGSHGETSSASTAMSHITGLAKDIAQKTGVSEADALAGLSRVALGTNVGVDSKESLIGKGVSLFTGAHGGVSLKLDGSNSSSHSNSAHNGVDSVVSAKDFSDFKNDLQTVMNYSKTHHYDTNNSQSENILASTGASLNTSQAESDSYNSSLADSKRISNASSFVTSQSGNISRNLNQEAFNFGAQQLGSAQAMIDLEANPGDSHKMDQLQHIKEDFLAQKTQSLIKEHGNYMSKGDVTNFATEGAKQIDMQNDYINQGYQDNVKAVQTKGSSLHNVQQDKIQMEQVIDSNITQNKSQISSSHKATNLEAQKIKGQVKGEIQNGNVKARTSATVGGIKSAGQAPVDLYNAAKNQLGE